MGTRGSLLRPARYSNDKKVHVLPRVVCCHELDKLDGTDGAASQLRAQDLEMRRSPRLEWFSRRGDHEPTPRCISAALTLWRDAHLHRSFLELFRELVRMQPTAVSKKASSRRVRMCSNSKTHIYSARSGGPTLPAVSLAPPSKSPVRGIAASSLSSRNRPQAFALDVACHGRCG